MALKDTWVTGDTYTATDQNDVADAVNALSNAYDLSIIGFGAGSVRAVGTGDNPMGVHLMRAVTISKVTYRCATADASGNLVVELRKNGAQIAGSPATIAAANQVAGADQTISPEVACAASDIITVYVTGIGTTPGKGLVADILGVA